MKKEHYLAPVIEIIGIDMDCTALLADSWSTDGGNSSTGIIDGNPDGGDDPYGGYEEAKGFGGSDWDDED